MVWYPWSVPWKEFRDLLMTVLMYIFVHLVTELFDTKTRKEWKTLLRKSSDPSPYENLRTFLENSRRLLEAPRKRGIPP